MSMFKKLIGDNRGVGTIEYALVASLISVAALAGYQNLGDKVTSQYMKLNHDITSVM